MSLLLKYIQKEIEQNGPMRVSDFMALCLMHPEYGYYMTRDPFGESGDFITAPEISQLFGEMIGLWAVQKWIQLGQPEKWTLIECGPGRGSLMQDLLRTSLVMPDFINGMKLYLLEGSPVLKAVQKDKLENYDPIWIDTIDPDFFLDEKGPVIIIGNEFLDALPVSQFQKINGIWNERYVDFHDGVLSFCFKEIKDDKKTLLKDIRVDDQFTEIIEISESVIDFWNVVLKLIEKRNGSALFIDYGYETQAFGETLQAVYKHEYCNVLKKPGEVDLTAHVNFDLLKKLAFGTKGAVYGPVSQSLFLKEMGILFRADKLKSQASSKACKDIDMSLNRLLSSQEMGSLFKVIGVDVCL